MDYVCHVQTRHIVAVLLPQSGTNMMTTKSPKYHHQISRFDFSVDVHTRLLKITILSLLAKDTVVLY